MCTPLGLTLVALLAVSVGTIKASVTVKKCCSEFKMLSGDLRTCVPSDWPRNVSLHRGYYSIVPPLDEEWLRFWLPPGVARQSIGKVELRNSPIDFYNVPVNTSSVWDKRRPLDADVLRNRAVFLRGTIVRPKPGGGYRLAFLYCIDAALPPQEAFVITLKTSCSRDECATKCCKRGQVLASQQGNWECEAGRLRDWDAQTASFAQDIDAEFPQSDPLNCPTLRLGAPEDRAAPWARSAYRVNLFSNWKPCFDFYRSNGTLQEGLFYCE
ncbi:hypothetical protein R5R35_000781 [Gryllus longicercus]|uniref:Uncharacterized protein n=1 Tax=Gryllus longicercus TaxID=2509291 RepID=A0AAN9Z4K9_9ORTH